MSARRIIIVDDHPLFRGALRESLRSGVGAVEILEAGTLDELTDTLARVGEIELVLLDLAMPGVRGLSGLMLLRAQYPGIPVVVVSARERAFRLASGAVADNVLIGRRYADRQRSQSQHIRIRGTCQTLHADPPASGDHERNVSRNGLSR